MSRSYLFLLLVMMTMYEADATFYRPEKYCRCKEAKKDYSVYCVVNVVPEDDAQLQVVKDLQNNVDLDFWFPPTEVNKDVQFMLPPPAIDDTLKILGDAGIKVVVLISDVQGRINDTYIPPGAQFDYHNFNSLEFIYEELQALADDCPQSLSCNVKSIGSSCQGRQLKVLTISTGSNTGRSLWIDSITQAREWLAGATTMKIFNKLIREYESDTDAADIIDRYEYIYFLPVANPDGYAYSHRVDRLWKKNRHTGFCNGVPDTQFEHCARAGVDLDRNFDVNWGSQAGSPSTSSDPCFLTYQGPHAASEPETKAIQNFISSKPGIDVFITFQSYARAWVYPNGDCSLPQNSPELANTVYAAADASKTASGNKWLYGNICDTFCYKTSGTFLDWAQQVAGIPNCFMVRTAHRWEKRPTFGYLASPDDIQASYDEIWAGLVALNNNFL